MSYRKYFFYISKVYATTIDDINSPFISIYVINSCGIGSIDNFVQDHLVHLSPWMIEEQYALYDNYWWQETVDLYLFLSSIVVAQAPNLSSLRTLSRIILSIMNDGRIIMQHATTIDDINSLLHLFMSSIVVA